MKKITVLLLVLGLLATPITAAVVPMYKLTVTHTYWTSEEQLDIDLNQDSVKTDEPILTIEGELSGVTNPSYDKFSVSGATNLYVGLSGAHYTVYITDYTPAQDTVLTLSYKDTTATPSIDLSQEVPVQTYDVVVNTATDIHSGASVLMTGTVVPMFEQTDYNVFVWRNGTKIVQAPVTDNRFTATFTAYGNVGTEYVLSVQPANSTTYNNVPYYKWTVTKLANVTLTPIPSVVPTGTVSKLRIKVTYGDQPLIGHQIVGTIQLGTTKTNFTATTDNKGQVVLNDVALTSVGLAQITATISKADGVYGAGSTTVEVTDNAAVSIELLAPDFVIGVPNTIQILSLRNDWSVETTTITVTGPVTETGTVLHGNSFIITPVSAGTIKLNIVATLKHGDQREQVEREFTYNIDGYIATVTPQAIPRGATTDIKVEVIEPDGTPVNNAIVMFVSPANTTTITIDGRTATGINNGVYKLSVPKLDNADNNSYIKVVADSKTMAYVPVPVAKSQAISIVLEPNEINVGPKSTIKVTLTSAASLGNVTLTIDKLLVYNVAITGTTWTGTLVVTPTQTGEYAVTAENPQSVGTATLIVKEPVVSITPTSLLINETATINIVSNGITDVITTLPVISKQVSATNAMLVVKPTIAGTATIEITYESGYHYNMTIAINKPKMSPVTATITTEEFIVTASTNLPQSTQVTITILGQKYVAQTDAQGMIMLMLPTKLPVGTYEGTIVADGYEQTSFTLYVVTSKLPELLYAVSPTTVAIGQENTLIFTLTDANRQPIKEGTIGTLTVAGTPYSFVVGANGSAIVKITLPKDTQFPVVVKLGVAGYKKVTFTLSEAQVIRPTTVIKLSVGMDVYTINGETKFWDAAPYIKNGRTMVPIRYLAEAIGFDVDWDFSDPNNQLVLIYKPNNHQVPYILFVIGQPIAMYNGQLIALDVAPEILNDRTMVPLRFVVETMGYTVNWQPPTIELTYP